MADIDDLFEQALELSAVEQIEFLERLPGEQREAMQKMLAADASLQQRADFLRPVAASAGHDEATFISNPNHAEPEKTFLSDSGTDTPKQVIGDNVRYFGEYELVEEIARGGMGVVFKARQVSLNRIVALKMILSGNLAGEEEVTRFKTEAEAAANLDHWGIVPIYEIGEHDGQHYFSMAFIEGDSLQDKVRNGPLDAREAAALCEKIATAIAYAHDRGVIHRDLKPANVLLDQDGQPKITDFGLAKQVQGESNLTQTGAVMGTPGYMPPEQASGDSTEVGPLADVYSLGAILYCLLTGRPPFQAASALDTLLQVVEKEPVSPRELNPNVPRDMETITLKCLEKSTDRRYESATELADELNRFLRGEPIIARPVSSVERAVRWAKRHRALAGLMATVLCVAIIAPWVAVRQGQLKQEADEKRSEAEILARNNEQLAEKNAQIAQQEAAQRATADEQRRIAEAKRREAETLAEENRKQLVAAELNRAGQLMNEDNTTAALPHLMRALRIDKDDPEQSRLHRIRIASAWSRVPKFTQLWRHKGAVNHVSCSADGSLIASAAHDGRVIVRSLVDRKEVADLQHRLPVWASAFSADGKQLATVSGTGLAGELRVWNLETNEEIGPVATSLTQQFHVYWTPQGRLATVAMSPNGTATIAVYAADSRKLLASVDYQLYGEGPRMNRQFFSADASRCVQLRGEQMPASTVRVLDLDNELKSVNEFQHPADVVSACVNADGSRLATFTAEQAFLWDVDSGERITETQPDVFATFGGLNLFMRSWFSFDGRRVIAGLNNEKGFVFEIDGKISHAQTLPLEDTVARYPAPNGRWMAFEDGVGTLRLWDMMSEQLVTSPLPNPGGIRDLMFTPDSRRVVIASADGTVRVWDLAAQTAITYKRWGHNYAPVRWATLTDDEETLISLGDGWARHANLETGENRNITFDARWLSAKHVNRKSSMMAFSTRNNAARAMNLASGEQFPVCVHDRPFVHGISLSVDDRYLATLACDGATGPNKAFSDAFVFETQTAKKIAGPLNFGDDDGGGVLSNLISSFTKKVQGVGVIRISPNNRLVAYGGGKLDVASGQLLPKLRFLNLETDEQTELDYGHGFGLSFLDQLTFSSSGRLLLSGGSDPMQDRDGEIRVWDVAKKEIIVGPLRFPGAIRSAVFSADERLVAIASDKAVHIFETSTGDRICPPLSHPQPVKDISIGPDGKFLATSTSDQIARNVRVWDLSSGRTIAAPIPYAFPIEHVTMLSDTRVMVCSHFDVRIHEYKPAETESLDDLEQAIRLLVGTENHLGTQEPCPPERLESDWAAITKSYPDRMNAVRSQVFAWYSKVLNQYHNERDWAATTFHRDSQMKMLPDDDFVAWLQANAYANNGQFDKAIPLFERCVDAETSDAWQNAAKESWRLYMLCSALLGAGDEVALKRWTKEFIKRRAESAASESGSDLAKILLLGKVKPDDPDLIGDLIEQSLAATPEFNWLHLSKALHEFRRGEFEACEATCDVMRRKPANNRLKALVFAVRGLAKKEADKPDWKQDIEAAREHKEAALRGNTEWFNDVHIDLLLREAEQVESQ